MSSDGPILSMGGQISGNGAAAPDTDLIKDSDTANFMADVVEASRQVPVIVDFWAPWCGPCKQLGPAIEKAVRAAGGRVRLVKVDVDKNQALAGQMRIQSIPTVYAFSNGQPVDGFQGALPESEIKAFIDRVAGPSSQDEQLAELLEAAKAALEDNNLEAAGQMFAAIVQADKDNAGAIAGLAKVQIAMDDLDAARATLEMVPADKRNDADVASAQATLDLAAAPSDTGEIAGLRAAVEADEKDHQARIDLATALNAAGQRAEALEVLIASIRADRSWNDDAARKQLLKFFEAWGPTDELTVSGRRQLSSILFS